MRTYAGHSDAARSNELYRRNLAKGQTGLSIAFDLPTQTGYDPDDELARGEVGKVGVSIAHRGDMAHAARRDSARDDEHVDDDQRDGGVAARALHRRRRGAGRRAPSQLQGTTQNDILKEYLSRGTYAFPPGPSMRLIADTIAYTVTHVPRWNPINICSYHLQEAGATPVQEIAYAMSNAIAVLDAVRERLGSERRPLMPAACSGGSRSSSTPASGSSRSTRSCARCRSCGMSSAASATASRDERLRRFRYGVQVNSLGLTEAQPENNVYRITLEALAVTLGRDARARALQLPAWNEALGLPRPWDQQWSLRLQQILALRDRPARVPDIFEGSTVMDGLVAELVDGAREEMAQRRRPRRRGRGRRLHEGARSSASQRERWRRIETGEQTVVGMNRFRETEPSPLTADGDGGILVVDPEVEAQRRRGPRALARSSGTAPRCRRRSPTSPRPPRDRRRTSCRATIAAARAGVTTGEWSATLREAFGEYRGADRGRRGRAGAGDRAARPSSATRSSASATRSAAGSKLLVGKPGLDGHSNGAEQIALRARDAGMDVVYEGIRLTPAQIATSRSQEGVHVVGLSILSGSHGELIPAVMRGARRGGRR